MSGDTGGPGRAQVADWAASGGMWLTGPAGGPPSPRPAGALAAARTWATAFARSATALGATVDLDVPLLLFGRAALAGYGRRGRTSAGGRCRLLRAADGWVAVNLARPDDEEAVPAVVGARDPGPAWAALAAFAAPRPAREVADRAQLLGVPAAALPPGGDGGGGGGDGGEGPAVRTSRLATRRPSPRPLVVDLSALWAGPLCAHLLGQAGATVVKVESPHRPDGSRAGVPGFFDWLHAGHRSVAVDLRTNEGRDHLLGLLRAADVVVDASRPRALRGLGIDAEAVVAASGCTWVSITGYGRAGDGADRVAFGDDAAVAGGLVGTDPAGDPVFCADAVADPLAGLRAAVAAAEAVAAGGGTLVEVSMRGVARDAARHAGRASGRGEAADVRRRAGGGWEVGVGRAVQEVRPPRRPEPAGRGPGLGEHTGEVLARVAAGAAP